MQAVMRRIPEDRYRLQRWPEPAIAFRDFQGVQQHLLDLDPETPDENVHVFRDHRSKTYVLVVDRDLGHVTLQAFEGDRDVGAVALKHPYEIRDALGRGGLDLNAITIARRLAAQLGRRGVGCER